MEKKIAKYRYERRLYGYVIHWRASEFNEFKPHPNRKIYQSHRSAIAAQHLITKRMMDEDEQYRMKDDEIKAIEFRFIPLYEFI